MKTKKMSEKLSMFTTVWIVTFVLLSGSFVLIANADDKKDNAGTTAGEPNGCGNKSTPWVPDLYFKNACDQHDRDYSTLDKPKAESDKSFLDNMNKACDKLAGPGEKAANIEDACRSQALGYYEVVKHSDTAAQAYADAQKEAKSEAEQNSNNDNSGNTSNNTNSNSSNSGNSGNTTTSNTNN